MPCPPVFFSFSPFHLKHSKDTPKTHYKLCIYSLLSDYYACWFHHYFMHVIWQYLNSGLTVFFWIHTRKRSWMLYKLNYIVCFKVQCIRKPINKIIIFKLSCGISLCIQWICPIAMLFGTAFQKSCCFPDIVIKTSFKIMNF